jgi:hypothetical protein
VSLMAVLSRVCGVTGTATKRSRSGAVVYG